MGSACVKSERNSVSVIGKSDYSTQVGGKDLADLIEEDSASANGFSEYDNALDDKIVERFLSKALCSGDVKTSLLTILSSEACKRAFYSFLSKNMQPAMHTAYVKNLEIFYDNYVQSNGSFKMMVGAEWAYQHATLVAKFVEDSTFKKWRAAEAANVLSAMTEVVCHESDDLMKKKASSPSPFRRIDSEEETLYDRSVSDLSSVEAASEDSCTTSASFTSLSSASSSSSSSSITSDVFRSVRSDAIESLSNGSVWLVQYLSMMEDFPVAFTLAKVEAGNATPLVYANKSFEKFSNQDRWSIVNTGRMDTCLRTVTAAEQVDCELAGDSIPFWLGGFKGTYAPVSVQAGYKFTSAKTCSQGMCSVSMKPIYNQAGELVYIASFYEPVVSKTASGLAVLSNIRRRNVKFLNNLPSIVNEPIVTSYRRTPLCLTK